ncbi:MAG: nucleoside deaminase [Bacilli bacterium]|nr:nucleoside deaminase [Bacilli bacterium]
MKKDFVDEIYNLAVESYNKDEIPVGAIVVKNNEIIGRGINNRENDNSVIGHAEINAIEEACRFVGDWRLDGCEMYVTLLPCMMCSGAILESRIEKVYYLCDRTNVCFKTGEYIDTIKIDDEELKKKYLKMLQLFFENKRN